MRTALLSCPRACWPLSRLLAVSSFAALALGSGCKSRSFGNQSTSTAVLAPAGIPTNWGALEGGVATASTPEAATANAAAEDLLEMVRLRENFAEAPEHAVTLVDAAVSIPLDLERGSTEPFGDGQRNAAPAYKDWSLAGGLVPASATWGRFEMKGKTIDVVSFVFASRHVEKLHGEDADAIDIELGGDTGAPVTFPLAEQGGGKRWRVVFVNGMAPAMLALGDDDEKAQPMPDVLKAALTREGWPHVRARTLAAGKGEPRYFPFLWRFPSKPKAEARASLPADQRAFAAGGELLDPPFAIGMGLPGASQPGLEAWAKANASIAKDYGTNVGVHDHFDGPSAGGAARKTATGNVRTFARTEKVKGTEVLYACFDARNSEAEAALSVPSGAGWHSIGEPTNAESIVNGFESSGIFSAWGVETPYPFSEEAPYGAKDVAVYRVVAPGEVFTTARGHFHWYAVDAKAPVCVTIVKHGCPLRSDTDLACR